MSLRVSLSKNLEIHGRDAAADDHAALRLLTTETRGKGQFSKMVGFLLDLYTAVHCFDNASLLITMQGGEHKMFGNLIQNSRGILQFTLSSFEQKAFYGIFTKVVTFYYLSNTCTLSTNERYLFLSFFLYLYLSLHAALALALFACLCASVAYSLLHFSC